MYKYTYAQIMQNMHKICIKYARNMQNKIEKKNMQKYAKYMRRYANICRAVSAAEI